MTGEQSSIGVLIATYTRDWCLKGALASAALQKRQPDEIVVVDDQPADSTSAIVREFAATEPGLAIRYLEHHGQSGGARSRTWAIEQMNVDYVALLDDDDRWKPNYLDGIEEAIDVEDPDVILCGFIETNQDGDEVGRGMPPDSLNKSDFMISNPGAVTSNIVYRRSAYIEVGGYDPSLKNSADRAIFVELSRLGKHYHLVEDHLVLRQVGHADQWSTSTKSIIHGKFLFARRYWSIMPVVDRLRTVKKLSLVCLGVVIEEVRDRLRSKPAHS